MTLAGDGSGGGCCQRQLVLALFQVQGGGVVELFEFFHGDGRPGRMHAEVFRFGLLREVGFDVGDLNGGGPDGTEVDGSTGGMTVAGFGGVEVQGETDAGVFLVEEYRGLEFHGEVGGFRAAGFLVTVGHGRADGGRWRACGDVALVMVPMVFPAVAGVAFITVERTLAVVAEHVGLELVGIAELLLAHLALVGFLAGVHSEVPPQVGDLDELPVAVRAGVGLLTGVKPHMGLEVVVPGESLVAFRAFEGLLAGVGSFVVLEDVLVAE